MPKVRSLPRLPRRLIAGTLTVGCALGVVAVAAPADASTGSASVGDALVSCSSSRSDVAPKLAHDLAGALHGRKGTQALALSDQESGTRCTLRAHTAFDSASVVKVTVLATLLRHAQEDGRGLTAHERRLATAMITKSDNDATTALWQELGTPAVRHFLGLAGMSETTPGTHGSWGLTRITANDELRLLHLLTTGNSVLDHSSRTYALGLMHSVEPSQRWGTPAGDPDTGGVHVKNGWLPRSSGGWRVHSIGAFTRTGHHYDIAALTQGNATMGYGIGTIENAARVIHHDIGRT